MIQNSHKRLKKSSLYFKQSLKALCLLTLVFTPGCASEEVQGEGEVKQEERTLENFQAIAVEHNYTLQIESGKPQKVTVEAPANLLGQIETSVQGGTLKITNAKGIHFRSSSPLKISISVPVLNRLEASGASNLTLNGISGPAFSMQLDGGHQVRVRGGELEKLTIKAAGAANIETFMLRAQSVDLQVSGAAAVRVRAEKQLNVDASGACKVEYTGNPQITQKLSGMSELHKL